MSFPLLIFTCCKSASKHLVLIVELSQQSFTDYDVLITKLPVTWLDPHDKKLISIYMTPNASVFSSTAALVDDMLGASWVFTSGFHAMFVLKSAVQIQNKQFFHY